MTWQEYKDEMSGTLSSENTIANKLAKLKTLYVLRATAERRVRETVEV